MTKKNRAKARRALLTLSLVLVVAFAAVGGTIAWLTANTETITNTFTASDIEITLEETKNLNTDGEWIAQVIPGMEYDKDPVVSVNDEKTNVDIYLFVQFDAENVASYVDYTSLLNEEKGWYALEGHDNVWYRHVANDAEVQSWHLLEGDKVTIKDDEVTLDNMDEAAAVEMVYVAYAVQYNGFEDNPVGAWNAMFPN